jgi:hypothetical protein
LQHTSCQIIKKVLIAVYALLIFGIVSLSLSSLFGINLPGTDTEWSIRVPILIILVFGYATTAPTMMITVRELTANGA